MKKIFLFVLTLSITTGCSSSKLRDDQQERLLEVLINSPDISDLLFLEQKHQSTIRLIDLSKTFKNETFVVMNKKASSYLNIEVYRKLKINLNRSFHKDLILIRKIQHNKTSQFTFFICSYNPKSCRENCYFVTVEVKNENNIIILNSTIENGNNFLDKEEEKRYFKSLDIYPLGSRSL